MPLLEQQPVPSPHPGIAPHPQDKFTWQLREDPAVRVDRSGCLCGARVPLGVRLGLRSRTRPVLDGRWCCSDACLQARVASIVRLGSPQAGGQRRHSHRVPLGLLLLQSGAVSQAHLREALERARQQDDRVGQVLVREFGLPEQALAAALAQQWGCTSWDLQGLRTDNVACLAPAALLERTGMVPVRQLEDGRIGVAFETDPDQQAVFALKRIHGRPVETGIARTGQIAEARRALLRADGVPATEVECESPHHLARELVRLLQRAQPVESRWARVHNLFWMRLWLEPAALAGGPTQREDVVDHVIHLPSGFAQQPSER